MTLLVLVILVILSYPSPPAMTNSSPVIMDSVLTYFTGYTGHILQYINHINFLRCNSRPDCTDLSDEFNCKKIEHGPSYQNFIAPPPLKSNHSEKNNKIIVEVSADIISILDIDEINSIFHVQFFLHLTWFDSRLKLYNLKTDLGLNTLSPAEKREIWKPVLVFENTELKQSTVVDDDSSLTVKKSGDFSLSESDRVENQQKFGGGENSLILSRFYNTRFICHYNMQWYPFDVQVKFATSPSALKVNPLTLQA